MKPQTQVGARGCFLHGNKHQLYDTWEASLPKDLSSIESHHGPTGLELELYLKRRDRVPSRFAAAAPSRGK